MVSKRPLETLSEGLLTLIGLKAVKTLKMSRGLREITVLLIWLNTVPTIYLSAQSVSNTVYRRCGLSRLEQVLQSRDPSRATQIQQLNKVVGQAIERNRQLRLSTTEVVYRIPVVVHVVHSNASNSVGGAQNVNIADDQIVSQLKVLNQDYRRLLNTNGFNTATIGADTGIEFFLAQTDPQGNSTTGITRHYYAQKSSFRVGIGSNDDILLAQIAYWPSDRYLNIWVTDLEDNYLGYTQFPTSADTLKGLVSGGSNEFIDGTIISYRAFGSGDYSLYRNYNLGRTLTHEIGHWLGLLHPNGDTPCGDDYVSDTPPTDDLNQTSSCTDLYATCSGKRYRELVENYMMYSPDACMNLFTAGQKERMRAVLQVSPRRAALLKAQTVLEEADQLTLTLLPNPAVTNLTAEIQFKGLQSFTLSVVNYIGQKVYALQYSNAPSSRIMLPTNALPAGLYMVQVVTATEKVTKRLLIQ